MQLPRLRQGRIKELSYPQLHLGGSLNQRGVEVQLGLVCTFVPIGLPERDVLSSPAKGRAEAADLDPRTLAVSREKPSQGRPLSSTDRCRQTAGTFGSGLLRWETWDGMRPRSRSSFQEVGHPERSEEHTSELQ